MFMSHIYLMLVIVVMQIGVQYHCKWDLWDPLAQKSSALVNKKANTGYSMILLLSGQQTQLQLQSIYLKSQIVSDNKVSLHFL